MGKVDLFLELASPDENGVSDWVNVKDFVGKYEALKLGNGGSWCRGSSSLQKKYIVRFNKELTSGNSIDAIKLCGYNEQNSFSQQIRQDIRDYYKGQKCVMLGVCGTSENTKIEIDHKDGRKNDARVADPATQKIEDFQPLSKAANDAKRQICKKCKETGLRWDATNIPGNTIAFYEGDKHFSKTLGCVGCYQYDPVEYRRRCEEDFKNNNQKNIENN